LGPEGRGDGCVTQVAAVVRSDHDGRVDTVESGVGDTLVTIDERYALAFIGTNEPVAILFFCTVATFVAIGTITSVKTMNCHFQLKFKPLSFNRMTQFQIEKCTALKEKRHLMTKYDIIFNCERLI